MRYSVRQPVYLPQCVWLLSPSHTPPHTISTQFTHAWRPEPPRSYEEALRRQQRLLHGPPRRAFLHLHRLAKELAFALMGAARAHGGSAHGTTHGGSAHGTAHGIGSSPVAPPSSSYPVQYRQQLQAAGADVGQQQQQQPQQQQQQQQSCGDLSCCTSSFAHAVCACLAIGPPAGGGEGGRGRPLVSDPTVLAALVRDAR